MKSIIFLILVSFLGGWIGFAVWALRSKKWSKIIAIGGGFIVGLVVLAVAGAIIDLSEPENPVIRAERTKKQAAVDRKERIQKLFSLWDGSIPSLTSIIKDSMNDPDSYKHVKTVYRDMGDHLIVITTFRGKNVFGGVVPKWVKAKVSLDGKVLEIIEQGN